MSVDKYAFPRESTIPLRTYKQLHLHSTDSASISTPIKSTIYKNLFGEKIRKNRTTFLTGFLPNILGLNLKCTKALCTFDNCVVCVVSGTFLLQCKYRQIKTNSRWIEFNNTELSLLNAVLTKRNCSVTLWIYVNWGRRTHFHLLQW